MHHFRRLPRPSANARPHSRAGTQISNSRRRRFRLLLFSLLQLGFPSFSARPKLTPRRCNNLSIHDAVAVAGDDDADLRDNALMAREAINQNIIIAGHSRVRRLTTRRIGQPAIDTRAQSAVNLL